MIKESIDQLVYHEIYKKFLKISWKSRSLIFSKHQTGFCRGFNVEHYLLVMLEKFRKALDKGGDYAALLTDLLKVFDCIPDDLIIAKLHAYGFNMSSLKLMSSYFTNWRVKINNSYTLWKLKKYDASPGSILSPVLFNIICFL